MLTVTTPTCSSNRRTWWSRASWAPCSRKPWSTIWKTTARRSSPKSSSASSTLPKLSGTVRWGMFPASAWERLFRILTGKKRECSFALLAHTVVVVVAVGLPRGKCRLTASYARLVVWRMQCMRFPLMTGSKTFCLSCCVSRVVCKASNGDHQVYLKLCP